METVLVGLIWLLIFALFIALVCYIVTRLASQFIPGFAAYAWIIWAIGGLFVLLAVIRLFAPALPKLP